MEAEGVELLAGLNDLAVMGFVEVVGRLGFFRRLEGRVRGLLQDAGIDLLICIDYPGFNLRATEAAHRAGVPVLFYIAPQVWAWKAHRARQLARTADRIAVILPFEEEIFTREGGDATFVGHPLLDREEGTPDRAAFFESTGLDPAQPLLALFPGSRRQEVERHLVPFAEAARRLQNEFPGLQVATAQADGIRLPSNGPPGVVVRGGQALLKHADAALVKSGTTTLEAALAGIPFVVAYRTHPVTWWLARRLVQVEHVALPNLVAAERVVPEFLQGEVRSDTLAGALAPLLQDSPERATLLDGLARVRERLGEPGAAARVAAMAVRILEERDR